MQIAKGQIEEIRDMCVGGVINSEDNEEIFVNLCNAENVILEQEIQKSIANDLMILITIISSDVMLEYFKEDMPNLEKIILMYEKMKDDNLDVSYFDITRFMHNVLQSNCIYDMMPDEIFEMFNLELENFINDTEEFKDYIDKI